MATLRFCAYQYQHLPLDVLAERWRMAEEADFDVVWNCDTVVEPDRPRHVMYDGPTTLTMMAGATSRIRVGTLVSTLHFRQPVPLAKATMTLDRLTGGRVELGLGVGDPFAGGPSMGVVAPPAEQVARFREFVELVDMLLRQEVTSYDGSYYQCTEAETIPRPVQRPHPPITIAAHGPKMLAIAAQFADSWSSFGGVETEADFYAVTAERCGGTTSSSTGRAATRGASALAGVLSPADALGVARLLHRHGQQVPLGRDQAARSLLARVVGTETPTTSSKSSSRSPAT